MESHRPSSRRSRSVMFLYLLCLVCFLCSSASFAQTPEPDSTPARPELVLQTGHGTWITSLSFSPDGSLLASLDESGIIKIHEIRSGRELRVLVSDESGREASNLPTKQLLTFNPDGSLIATCSGSFSVRIWVVATGARAYSHKLFAPETDAPACQTVSFSSTGKLLNIETPEGLFVVDLIAGRIVDSVKSPYATDSASLLAATESMAAWAVFDPDDMTRPSKVEIRPVDRRKRIGTLRPLDVSPLKAEFSTNGRWLAIESGPLEIWEVSRAKKRWEHAATSFAFSPDSRFLAIGYHESVASEDSETSLEHLRALPAVRLVEPETGRQVGILTGFDGHVDISYVDGPDRVGFITFSPDGSLVAASLGHEIMVWDVGTGNWVQRFLGRLDWAEAPRFDPAGQALYVGGLQNPSVWNLEKGYFQRKLAKQPLDWISREFAVSPDGRSVATVTKILNWGQSPDRSVRVWDVDSGRSPWGIAQPEHDFVAVAFSPDGRVVAAGDTKGSVKLWEARTGQKLQTLDAYPDGITKLQFSEDGRQLITSGFAEYPETEVVVWNLETGKRVKAIKIPPASHSPQALAIGGNGRWVASAKHGFLGVWEEPTIVLYDLQRDRKIPLRGALPYRGYVSVELAFSFDGRLLGVNTDSNEVLNTTTLWETETGKRVSALSEQLGEVSGIALNAGGTRVALALDESRIAVWDVTSGNVTHASKHHDSRITSLVFGQDDQWIVSSSEWPENSVRIWEAATGREVRALRGHRDSVLGIALSPDGRLLASAGGGIGSLQPRSSIKFWDVESGETLGELGGRGPLVFSSDGHFLLKGNKEGALRGALEVWDVVSSRLVSTMAVDRDPEEGAVALDAQGSWLATGHPLQLEVNLWELETGQKLADLSSSKRAEQPSPTSFPGIEHLLFNPQRSQLVGVRNDLLRFRRDVVVWSVPSGAELALIDEAATAVAFSPDGSLLATCSFRGMIGLWDTTAWKRMHEWPMPTPSSCTPTFSPEGRWLLTSEGTAGLVRLWDIHTGEERAALGTGPDGKEWVVFSPDGLFDGSPAAWRHILWRFGGNTFDVAPVEVFFNEFYNPGLLAEILKGKQPKAPRDITQLDRRQPDLKLSAISGQLSAEQNISERTVTVRIEVAELAADAQRTTGSGAQDLRLFRNGSLVKVWRGDLALDEHGGAVLEASVPIVAGENRFTAYAFNRDNIKSADATLVVTGAESLRRKGTAYILAIGINQYANSDYNLNYAVPDARAFADELQRQQQALGAFERVEVVSLLDRDATKANLLRALARLGGADTASLLAGSPLARLKRAEPEDAVLVYYAGHGAASGPRFYLIPHDLGYAGKLEEIDEAGLKTLLAHSLDDRDLERAFEGIDAGQILLVIDACNSGQALEAEEKRRGPMNSKGLAQLAYEKGMYILTAAQGYQAALEVAQLGHGLLTYALVEEALKTPAADEAPKDGQVVMREWLDFAALRVPQLQTGALEQARKARGEADFANAAALLQEMEQQLLQRPRVFYRREPEAQPLVIARPAAATSSSQ